MRSYVLLSLGLLLAGPLWAHNEEGPKLSQLLADAGAPSWLVVGEILNHNCTACHIAGSSFARQSGLALGEVDDYEILVDVVPQNRAAAADGLVRISSAGGQPGLGQSYLWEKINVAEQAHFYKDHPHYGALMPLGQPPLSNGELAYIRTWIEAGAPQVGIPAAPELLADSTLFQVAEFIPPDPPEQGMQLHLGPFEVFNGEDREFLYYQPLPTEAPVYISGYEIAMRSGSHHFILYNYPQDRQPPQAAEVFRDLRSASGQNNDAVLADISQLFPFRMLVGTQVPYSNYRFPPGVALELPAGHGFDLNAHYLSGDQTVQGEVYVNLHTVDADQVQFVARQGSFSNFDIFLPAGQETTIVKEFTFAEDRQIVQMWSHAHQKMTEFTIEMIGGPQDGELLYWTNDWEHPPLLELDPPLTVRQGQGVRLSTTWNNDTDRAISYGLRSTDEMQFLFYLYYTEGGEVIWLTPPVGGDLVIFDDDLADEWGTELARGAGLGSFSNTVGPFAGSLFIPIAVAPEQEDAPWNITLRPPRPVDHQAVRGLKLALHPGSLNVGPGDTFNLIIEREGPVTVDLLAVAAAFGVDFERKEWQQVEIPLALVGGNGPIEAIRLSGTVRGTFYLDDVRLLNAAVVTAVEEEVGAVAGGFTLEPNVPNPFNSETVIKYQLETPGNVRLVISDVLGRKVAELVAGWRSAGVHQVHWNGRDEAGRALASGVYLYRLQVGEKVESRKLMLLR